MGRKGGSGETKEQKPAPLKLPKARQALRGSAVKIVVKKNGKFQHFRTGLVQPPVSTSSGPGVKRPKRHQSIKAPFPNREKRHFNFGASEHGILLLRRLRLAIPNFKSNGFGKPQDIARLLNNLGVTTACGERWTKPLAEFLVAYRNKNPATASVRKPKLRRPI